LAALGRRSAGHHQDLEGETRAGANQADEGRWRNRAAGHRTAGHSMRMKKLGGGAAHLKEQNQGRSRDELWSGGTRNESSHRAAAAPEVSWTVKSRVRADAACDASATNMPLLLPKALNMFSKNLRNRATVGRGKYSLGLIF
jgi:hypothetical protein